VAPPVAVDQAELEFDLIQKVAWQPHAGARVRILANFALSQGSQTRLACPRQARDG
jgi:hypothetical protein